jgi:hypothetical protein
MRPISGPSTLMCFWPASLVARSSILPLGGRWLRRRLPLWHNPPGSPAGNAQQRRVAVVAFQLFNR